MAPPYKGNGSTANGQDIINALQKRLTTQGYNVSDSQLMTLMIDMMVVINTDNATIVSQAATEIAQNKQRPFIQGV